MTPPTLESVFQLEVRLHDSNTFFLDWHIKPRFFLYQKSIRIIEPPPMSRFAEIAPIHLPRPVLKKDSRGRIFEVYRKQLQVPLNVLGLHAGETTVQVTYQGCADDGYCYPPQTSTLQLTFDKYLALTKVSLEDHLNPVQKSESWSYLLKNPFEAQFLVTLFIFYVLGLLLSFTPCVLPMVPVLSSIIVGRSQNISTQHAFGLSLTYVLSMSVTYAIVGAGIAMVGKNIQLILQTPLAIGCLSLFFIFLSLSMFNLFELKLPVSWQSKLAEINYRQSHGHYINACVMGCLSTLILSPCVTAPLIGVLGYIADTGNLYLGIFALFMLGLGMGTPLLLIGTSLGRFIPKKGGWMEQVKGIFGLILIGVSIDLLARIIPSSIIMFCWSALFFFSGLYLGAFKLGTTNLAKLKQAFALILFGYGCLILIGISQGHTNPWSPLSITMPQQKLITVRSLDELTPYLNEAKRNHKPVMIDFYADWCKSCKIIDEELETNKELQETLASFNIIRADITQDNPQTRALNIKYHVIAPPTFIFISQQGVELKAFMHAGEISPKALNNLLQQILEE